MIVYRKAFMGIGLLFRRASHAGAAPPLSFRQAHALGYRPAAW